MNPLMSSLLDKLHASEYSDNLLDKQQEKLQRLLEHAQNTVPFYQDYDLKRSFAKQPILSRSAVQLAQDKLTSTALPEAHGNCYPLVTSGSTGEAVQVLSTDLTQRFYDALMLREHAWHKRDLHQKLMSIRYLSNRKQALAPLGERLPTWGPPISHYQATGPSVLINITSSTSDQVEALLMHEPAYLLSYPSQIQAIAEYCLEQNIQLSFLQEIRTTGEVLTKHHKTTWQTLCPQAVITDVYSCVEIGNIAQMCPEYRQYHINAEHVYLEIVDDKGKPCATGKTGKVLVTSLLNYATPLIRYELGDYASFGEPCPCGRTLPVLQKISGRKRNRLTLPSGETRFPYLGDIADIAKVAPIRIQKFQFIQHTPEQIEIKVVTPDTITHEQEQAFKALYQDILGYAFEFEITPCPSISPAPSGKYEEFVSYFTS